MVTQHTVDAADDYSPVPVCLSRKSFGKMLKVIKINTGKDKTKNQPKMLTKSAIQYQSKFQLVYYHKVKSHIKVENT